MYYVDTTLDKAFLRRGLYFYLEFSTNYILVFNIKCLTSVNKI